MKMNNLMDVEDVLGSGLGICMQMVWRLVMQRSSLTPSKQLCVGLLIVYGLMLCAVQRVQAGCDTCKITSISIGNAPYDPYPTTWFSDCTNNPTSESMALCGEKYITLNAGGGCCMTADFNYSYNPQKIPRPFKIEVYTNVVYTDYQGDILSGYTIYHLYRDENDPKDPTPFSVQFTVEDTLTKTDPQCIGDECSDSTTATLNVGGQSCSCANPNAQSPQTPSIASGNVDNECVDFKVNLGPATYWTDAGYLELYAEEPSTSLASPAALQLPLALPNVEVITNASGVLEQVHTPMCLANIVVENDYLYQIQFFASNNVTGMTNGLYGTNGTPLDIWEIQNPDTNAAYNRLWITEKKPGLEDRQFQFTYSNASTQAFRWDLLEPDGVTTISKWQEPNSTNSTITNYYHVVYSGTNILQQECLTKQSVPIVGSVPSDGLLTLSRVEGAGGVTNSTTYTYYPTNAAGGIANRLQRVDNSDGSWAYNVYDESGHVVTNYSAYGNNPPPTIKTNVPDPATDLCKQTVNTYDSYGQLIQTDASVPDGSGAMREIASSYHTHNQNQTIDEVASNPGIGSWGAGNLFTVTWTYDDSDPVSAGRIKSVTRPDGTATLYSYTLTATNFITVESTGQPDYWYSPSSIQDGTETETTVDLLGRIQSKVTKDILSGKVLSQETYIYSASDPYGHDYYVVDLAGRTNTYEYACCGLDSSVDPDGVGTSYTYDSMKRVTSTSVIRGSSWVTTTNQYDGLGRVLLTQRIGTNSSTMTLSQSAYDVLGRVIRETNALNGVTRHDFAVVDHQQYVTNTYPDGGTRIEVYQRDGRLQSVSGTAVSPVEYQYGVEQDASGYWREYTLEIMLDANGGTNEWVKTCSDAAGRTYKTVYSGATTNPYSMSYYDQIIPGGQLTRQVDPDGISTLYGYNDQGRQDLTVADMDQDGYINYWGEDRINLTTNDVVSDHGYDVKRTQTFVWATNSDGTETLVSTREASTDGLRSWNTVWNNGVGATSQSVTVYAGSGYRYVTNTAPDNSYTITTYHYGQMVSATQYASNGSQIGQVSYGYDAFWRLNTQTDARNGTTTTYYNNADQVSSTVTPPPASGQSAEVTTNTFDQMGRLLTTKQPDNTVVSNVYYPNGLLALTYGSRTYPVGYSYDVQGRMKTMTNWTSFASAAGARVTTWNYDPYRGFLSSKDYADGNGPSYGYTDAGRLATRMWERGVTASYAYDAAGSLTNIVYSDATPAVTNTYDRLGRLITVDYNGMTESLVYNDANEVLSDTYSGGILDGVGVTNSYDQYLRRTNVTASSASAQLLSTAYGYDNASRLQTVSDGTDNATYTYLANSPLVDQIVFKQNSTTRMTTTKDYDDLSRLTGISSTPSADAAFSFNYHYNSADQRTSMTNADNSHWVYQYDSLGQVTSGKKYWSDGTPVAGQQFEYGFDDIGNRQTTAKGGDQYGANLRYATYSANNLNQITSRTVPGYEDVLGTANSNATVTVNLQKAYRKGDYFRAELGEDNTGSALWLSLTNLAVLNDGSNPDIITTNTGSAFLLKTPEAFSYDADGNLTNDGRFSYVWDGENRLTSLTSLSSAPNGSKVKLEFAYDAKGRRIEKVVSTYNGSSYVAQSTNRFVYDGWNLLAVLDDQSALVKSFVWGTDLSGSMQGAGGVGGLLLVSYHGASTTNCFAAYDGNGNLMALINVNDGTMVANYEYGPFGEVIRASGPMAKVNPFRFSTKYEDDESDLLYYGYRYYNPSTGTWLNRDSIEEKGGLNLYGFVQNAPNDRIDSLGNLSYQTEKAPQPGTCGTFSPWVITWHLSDAAKMGGYVIQHMRIKFNVTDCKGNKISKPDYDYYEAISWIYSGGLQTGNKGDDQWFNTMKNSILTKGSVTFEGTATFYDNGLSPKGFSPGNGFGNGPGQGPWGYAPHSSGPPSPPSSWSGNGSVSRTLTASWNCCCPHKLDTVLSYN